MPGFDELVIRLYKTIVEQVKAAQKLNSKIVGYDYSFEANVHTEVIRAVIRKLAYIYDDITKITPKSISISLIERWESM